MPDFYIEHRIKVDYNVNVRFWHERTDYNMKKIMLFEGDIETQGYFSIQLAEAFQKMGHQTFIFDLSRPWESTERFSIFMKRGIRY